MDEALFACRTHTFTVTVVATTISCATFLLPYKLHGPYRTTHQLSPMFGPGRADGAPRFVRQTHAEFYSALLHVSTPCPAGENAHRRCRAVVGPTSHGMREGREGAARHRIAISTS
eukprot:5413485-Prymnesium_polylepis.1